MNRRRTFVPALVVAGALLAGCGGGAEEPELYRLGPTTVCLKNDGLPVFSGGLDFVASTALGGAARAKLPDNEVTLAFGTSEEDAAATAQAYRRFAGKTIPIDNVLMQAGNVVLLWNAPPSEEDADRVRRCLSGSD